MCKEQVLSIVREMPIKMGEINQTVYYLSQATEVEVFNFWNVFNYGYMLGKQAERARKKKPLTRTT